MRWHYDLTHAEPIIRDEPVFSQDVSGGASNKTINAGALMHFPWDSEDALASTAISCTAGAAGICLIPAYSSSTSAMATKAVGVMLETPYLTGTCSSYATSVASTTGGGPQYAKVIINPYAVYYCEQSTGTSDDAAITSTSTTTVTIPSLVDDLDGNYVYFPLTASGVKGSLRFLTASAAGSATMYSALTTSGDSSDTAIIILSPHKHLWPLISTSDKCGSGAASASSPCVNLKIIQTYIDRDAGIEIMRPATHKACDNLNNVKGGNGPKFIYDVIMKKHLYGSA